MINSSLADELATQAVIARDVRRHQKQAQNLAQGFQQLKDWVVADPLRAGLVLGPAAGAALGGVSALSGRRRKRPLGSMLTGGLAGLALGGGAGLLANTLGNPQAGSWGHQLNQSLGLNQTQNQAQEAARAAGAPRHLGLGLAGGLAAPTGDITQLSANIERDAVQRAQRAPQSTSQLGADQVPVLKDPKLIRQYAELGPAEQDAVRAGLPATANTALEAAKDELARQTNPSWAESAAYGIGTMAGSHALLEGAARRPWRGGTMQSWDKGLNQLGETDALFKNKDVAEHLASRTKAQVDDIRRLAKANRPYTIHTQGQHPKTHEVPPHKVRAIMRRGRAFSPGKLSVPLGIATLLGHQYLNSQGELSRSSFLPQWARDYWEQQRKGGARPAAPSPQPPAAQPTGAAPTTGPQMMN